MAQEKISELSVAAALDGSELVPVVQGGATKKTTTQDIADLGGGGGSQTLEDVLTTGNDITSPQNIDIQSGGALTIGPPASPNLAIGIGETGITVSVTDVSLFFDEGSNRIIVNDSRGTPKGIENGAAGYVTQPGSYTDKQYVDGLIATEVTNRNAAIVSAVEGLKWKDSVKVATTVAGTLATSFENGDTIDGVALVTGDRILIKNQASAVDNGIYIVAASGAPTRSTDANSAAELEGATVPVQQGTSNANTSWTQTTDGITLGVSNIVFAQLGTSVPDSSETVKGIIEIATQAETHTGTDDVRGITPLKLAAEKEATGGIAGLTLFKINFKNVANTFISFFTNSNTAARTYTFQDRNGTIADDTDLAAKQATLVSGTNIKTVNSTTLLGSGNLAVGDALVANPLSQFASTTSAQLAGVMTDETGSGALVFATSPTLVTPALGTPSALVATNATGTAAGLTAGAATVLATARTINQTSFNGSANVVLTANSVKTANYSILSSDVATIIRGTASSDITFTVDQLTTGDRVGIINDGTANIIFAQGSGVTISGLTSLSPGLTALIYWNSATDVGIKGGNVSVNGTYVITTSTTQTGNATTVETDLFTYTIPGATLGSAGEAVIMEVGGTFAATVNSKRVRIRYGATTVFDTGVLAITTSNSWTARCVVRRVDGTNQKAFTTFTSSSTVLSASTGFASPGETLSGNVIFKVTGTATANNDMTGESFSIIKQGH